LFLRNFARFNNDEPLHNIVDLTGGY